jgi:hypothetical protein
MRYKSWQSKDAKWWVYDTRYSKLLGPYKTEEKANKSAKRRNNKESELGVNAR